MGRLRRNDNDVEVLEHEGFTIRITPDDCPSNPREEWDNAGRMVGWHNRYNLGDPGLGFAKKRGQTVQFPHPSDFQEWREETEGKADGPLVVLPLWLYDHSGITIYVGNGPLAMDAAGWDSGQVGYIYMTTKKANEEWPVGEGRTVEQQREQVIACLKAEVQTYDQFLTGQVYCYTVEDSAGDVRDSCCGFYGLDYCIQEAKSQAEWLAKQVDAAREREMEMRDGA